MSDTSVKTKPIKRTISGEILIYNLIIYNDDINSFTWIIKSLIEICKHTPEQAQQCAMITHNTGKCIVKQDSQCKLNPLLIALKERNIKCSIDV